MKKINCYRLLLSILILPLMAKSQSSDFSKFSGTYDCFEILEHPKYTSLPNYPQPGECWVANKKYESKGSWLITYPFKVEIAGTHIKVLNIQEYYFMKAMVLHYKDYTEGESEIINNVAEIKLKHYQKGIEPKNDKTIDDNATMSVDLSNQNFLIVTITQTSKNKDMSPTVHKIKYKKL